MPSETRRRLFQLPPRSETELSVQPGTEDVDLQPEEDELTLEKQDAQVTNPEDNLKNKITRSIIRMLKKKGAPNNELPSNKPVRP